MAPLLVAVRTAVSVSLLSLAAAAELAEASTPMVVEEELVVGQHKASGVPNEGVVPCSLEELVDHHIDGS